MSELFVSSSQEKIESMDNVSLLHPPSNDILENENPEDELSFFLDKDIPNIEEWVYKIFKKCYNKNDLIYPCLYFDEIFIESKIKEWTTILPWIHPYYDLKANNFPLFLKKLLKYNLFGFNVSSPKELYKIQKCWIENYKEEHKDELEENQKPSSDECESFMKRILYSYPIASPFQMKTMLEQKLNLLVIDSIEQIKLYHHLWSQNLCEFNIKINVLIRIGVNIESQEKESVPFLENKFGANSDQIKEILDFFGTTKDLSFECIGFSFHVGSNYLDPKIFNSTLKKIILGWIPYSIEKHQLDIKMIDIGGGFDPNFSLQIYEPILKQWKEKAEEKSYNLKWIAEPGRYFCANAFHLISRVQSIKWKNKKQIVYIEDGCYGYLNEIIFNKKKYYPLPLYDNSVKKVELFNTTIYGPSCHDVDKIIEDLEFPELKIGDPIWFPNIGAYSLVNSTDFNGFEPSPLLPINLQSIYSDKKDTE